VLIGSLTLFLKDYIACFEVDCIVETGYKYIIKTKFFSSCLYYSTSLWERH
jgi:hypothetical protein